MQLRVECKKISRLKVSLSLTSGGFQMYSKGFQPLSCIHRSAPVPFGTLSPPPCNAVYRGNSFAVSSPFRCPSWPSTSAWWTSRWSSFAWWCSCASPSNPSSCSPLGSRLAGLTTGHTTPKPLYIQIETILMIDNLQVELLIIDNLQDELLKSSQFSRKW